MPFSQAKSVTSFGEYSTLRAANPHCPALDQYANISPDADSHVIRDALFKNQVLVFKNQGHVSPKAQFELTRSFDPVGTSYGHGKTIDAKRSILHPDLKTIREFEMITLFSRVKSS